MAWEFNDEVISEILESAGFDSSIGETVNGIKDEQGVNHQIYINSKGRIRYQYARLLSTEEKSISLAGKQFEYDKEKRDIVNITGKLEDIGELVQFLRDVSVIIRKGM